MKTPYAIGLVVASVLITVVIEESRMSVLRTEIETGKLTKSVTVTEPPSPSRGTNEQEPPPSRTKNRSELKPTSPAVTADTEEESLVKSARMMWDNPAGKSMMNQGVKMAVAMMYQDFIDSLKLSKEEGDYFKNLLAQGMSNQQEIGMKMLGASEEEQKVLVDEMTKKEAEHEEEIKKFLNNGDDYKSYKDYGNHMPERQQLDQIRSTMSSKGLPLDKETETKLVDAMYRARTESNTPDLSGPKGIEKLSDTNLVEDFEKGWATQQEILLKETSQFLNEAQQAAFQEQQKQSKEFHIMSLKMAETMMSGKKDKNK
ncbi:MAG: hypothetical protein H8M99_09005 [Gloeobacteraceae cyanobacterium ES-bin-144]|nr:hypothetical protein [Verrucomicrobiales bacterium]